MTDNTTLLPLVQKFFENDLNAAAGVLESMPEEEAAGALRSLPIPLAVRVVKVLQISYAAALLKDADDQFLIEMTSHLDPQFLASITDAAAAGCPGANVEAYLRKTKGTDQRASGVPGGQHWADHDHGFHRSEKGQSGRGGH